MTSRTLGVALLGCGTVGAAVVRAMEERAHILSRECGGPIELRHVAVRSPLSNRGVTLPPHLITTDAKAATLADDVDITVELIGGEEPAATLIGAALDAGRGVVTANKAVIAGHGPALAARARPNSGGLAFEAAVGAGTPVVATLLDSLRADRIEGITAVLNGTTNFIIERMRAGEPYPAALTEAQQLGYAERDPTSDVDGHDAASKLAILAWLGMGATVTASDVERRGIRDISPSDIERAADAGGALRLVARAQRVDGTLTLSVQPSLVPAGHPLAEVSGVENCVVLDCDLAGRLQLRGAGAGAQSTASAVLSDLIRVASARRAAGKVHLPASTPVGIANAEVAETAAMIRVGIVASHPEAPQVVAQVLADRGVPVAEMLLPSSAHDELVVLTAKAPRALLGRALETLESVSAVTQVRAQFDRLEASP